MSGLTDCFIIGYNEFDFNQAVQRKRMLNPNSVEYRDLELSFIKYKNYSYDVPGIYNKFIKNSPYGKFSFNNVFSNTIAYLGTYLKKNGFSFDYLNSFQDGKDYLKEQLLNDNILSIAISTTFYLEAFPITEIIRFIKSYNQKVKIIVGGPYIDNIFALNDQFVLEYFFKMINADYYVRGLQSEQTLVDIVTALKNNLSIDDRIKNLSYKKGNVFFTTQNVLTSIQLENNMVNWHLFNDNLGPLVCVRTSVSCPFSCLFCNYYNRMGKYQYVSIEAIEYELNLLSKTGKIKHVFFTDDTFNVPQDRFKKILKMMIKNRYKFKWSSFYRCQFADSETVELMKESGCESVLLGIESGSNDILNNMNKMADIDKYLNGIDLLNENKIIGIASFIIGFLGETEKTIAETKKFIKEANLPYYRTQVWYASPLSPAKEIGEKKYNLQGSGFLWSHSTMNSNEAMNHLINLFLEVKKSINIPSYGFEYLGFSNLIIRSKTKDNVKEFIKVFNQGIVEKLKFGETSESTMDDLEKKINLC